MSARIAALVLLLAACPSSDDPPEVADQVPATLRDTTGAQFDVVNGDVDELQPRPGTELPPACSGEQPSEFEFWLGETGLGMICVLDSSSGGPIAEHCRPIACDSVAECIPGFSCVGGICRCTRGVCLTTPGNGRVEDIELVALCLADHARSAMCPIGIEYASLYDPISIACDEETDLCSIPTECR
jgi:hypothetical protein